MSNEWVILACIIVWLAMILESVPDEVPDGHPDRSD